MIKLIKAGLPICGSTLSKDQFKITRFTKTPNHNLNGANVRSMAGHSKWQNIKHIKAAKDAEKSRTNTKFIGLLKRAALEGGGPNPKTNSKLTAVISQAYEQNVSGTTIDNALKRLQNAKLKPFKAEVVGSGGSLFVIEMECEIISQTIHSVKTVCKKVPGYRLAQEGRTDNAFNQKGVIKISKIKEGGSLNNEKVLDDAILAGAEEVTEEKDDNDNTIFKFVTSLEDFHKVKKELESMQYIVDEFNVEYIPYQKITLSEDDMNNLSKFYTLLDDLPDVQRIFDNVEY